MHREILGYVARRGAAYAQGTNNLLTRSLDDKEPSDILNLKPAEIAVLVSTFVIGLVCYGLIKYQISGLVTTLAIVEDRSTTVSVTQETKQAYTDEKSPLIDIEEIEAAPVEVTITNEKPLTTSIRATLKYLTTLGGRSSRLRGIGVYLILQLLLVGQAWNYRIILTMCFPSLNIPAKHLISSVLAWFLFSRMHLLWVTRVVGRSTTAVVWYRGVPQGNAPLGLLALPAMGYAIAEWSIRFVPRFVHQSFGPVPTGPVETDEQAQNELTRVFASLATFVVLGMLVYIPALVTLVRCEASMLTEATELILPFERTLGGTAPKDGKAPLGLRAWYRAAWRSYGREGRRRLIRLFVKTGLVMLAFEVLFGIVMGFEVLAIGQEKSAQLVNGLSQKLDAKLPVLEQYWGGETAAVFKD